MIDISNCPLENKIFKRFTEFICLSHSRINFVSRKWEKVVHIKICVAGQLSFAGVGKVFGV